MPELLASLEDINANLPSDANVPVVVATEDNTGLIQISIARVIRGYLSRVMDNNILLAWVNPVTTPDIIREVAAKLIASQLFFNRNAEQSLDIDEKSFAQIKYDEAMAILNNIIAGTVVVPNVLTTATEGMSLLDGWPIDSTDRSFTKGMLF